MATPAVFGKLSPSPADPGSKIPVVLPVHSLPESLGQALGIPIALATGHTTPKVATEQPGTRGPRLHS